MKAYRTELDPNNVQRTAMLQHCGAARWAYNWGLEQIKAAADNGEKWPSAFSLCKRLVAIKGTDALPWGYTVSKSVFEGAFHNLETAIENWRGSKAGQRTGPKAKFPRRKSRKHGIGSCQFRGSIRVFDGAIQLPRIGLVRVKEHGYIPAGKYGQATISEQAGHWFVSVLNKCDRETTVLTDEVIGIDVGIKTLAVCSDGAVFANPKALSAKTKQMRRWQRKLSRRQKGSANRTKAKLQVARLHKQIGDIRRDAHNKAARAIVNKRPAIIVLENLNVNVMFKNHKLAKALSDAAFGDFGRIVTHMAADAGIEVRRVERFFASSKICSCCGWKKNDLTLANRTFVCGACGLTLDRDLNAALNLKHTVRSTGFEACGDYVSPGTIQATVDEAGTDQRVGNSICLSIGDRQSAPAQTGGAA